MLAYVLPILCSFKGLIHEILNIIRGYSQAELMKEYIHNDSQSINDMFKCVNSQFIPLNEANEINLHFRGFKCPQVRMNGSQLTT